VRLESVPSPLRRFLSWSFILQQKLLVYAGIDYVHRPIVLFAHR
jgi:hypothetical protein